MASETPIHKLPYPEPADIPDIAGDIQKLATAVDGLDLMHVTSTASDPITTYASNFKRPTTPIRPFASHRAGPFVSFEIHVQRSVSDLSGGSTGDFFDVSVGTLATDIPRPINPVFVPNGSGGPVGTFSLMPDGGFWLGNMAPGGVWTVGVVWNTAFFYLAAV